MRFVRALLSGIAFAFVTFWAQGIPLLGTLLLTHDIASGARANLWDQIPYWTQAPWLAALVAASLLIGVGAYSQRFENRLRRVGLGLLAAVAYVLVAAIWGVLRDSPGDVGEYLTGVFVYAVSFGPALIVILVPQITWKRVARHHVTDATLGEDERLEDLATLDR